MSSSVNETSGQQKPVRSLSQKLAMYLLYTESGVIFFLTIVVFGMKILTPAWAFGGGAVLFVLFIVAGRMTNTRAGMWVGWALQVGLVLLGFVKTEMFFIGALFALMWIYTLVKARQIELGQQ